MIELAWDPRRAVRIGEASNPGPIWSRRSLATPWISSNSLEQEVKIQSSEKRCVKDVLSKLLVCLFFVVDFRGKDQCRDVEEHHSWTRTFFAKQQRQQQQQQQQQLVLLVQVSSLALL